MEPVSPFFALLCLLVAVVTAYLLTKKFGEPAPGRYATIDGLRGYLAFFVFLHHACIWYFFLRTGQWEVPNSHLYTHFGQSSVLIFFMITGFLFFSKLLDARTKNLDWGRLFVSRILRLAPLYLFAMLLLFLTVFVVTRGTLHEPVADLMGNMLRWLGFTIFGAPGLNGFQYTPLIIAGVTWSLTYEWLFYLSLPLLALSVGVVAPVYYLVLGAIGVAVVVIWNPQFYPLIQMIGPLLSFLGGMAAALLVRKEGMRRWAAQGWSSPIVLTCLVAVVAVFPSANGPIPVLLLALAFALIACGNSLFGILLSPISHTLGEMAYSIYLLHGILLFVVFNFLIERNALREMTPTTHWLLVAGTTPILILICFATFKFIESPAMRSTAAVTTWLRVRLSARSTANVSEHL